MLFGPPAQIEGPGSVESGPSAMLRRIRKHFTKASFAGGHVRERGRLVDWNDERGFGFITPLGGDARVFAHVSEFPRELRRPMALDLVTYTVETDDRGRLRALGIQFLVPAHSKHVESHAETDAASGIYLRLAISVSFLAVLAIFTLAGVGNPWLLTVYCVLSILAFATYGADKSAARDGGWRVSESSLHFLALAGGWPGALIAQSVFHHKTRKQPFQGVFWGTVIGNCVLLAVFLAVSAAAHG